jgi:16S rRNA (guanine966-N2)-methyltransferase
VRIIAGKWRGRPIVAPAGQATRPTSDRTREALFSMLASRLGSFEGLAVADLFAGSGALGLEALSRGAARCTFVETDRNAIDVIRRNLAACGVEAEILAVPAEQARISGPLDLAFLDPPYRSGLAAAALPHLALAPGGYASVETARDESLEVDGYDEDAVRTYGKAKITLLRRRG